IGRGIACELASIGFDVAIADLERDEDAEETLATVASRGARGMFVTCDVSDVEGHAAVIDAVRAELGPLTCLVNNAVVSVANRGDLPESSRESFGRLMRINLRGTFFLTQRVAAGFVAGEAANRYRSIINISSTNAYSVSTNRGEYCLSKSAIG